MANAEEKRHMDRVADMGCIVCRDFHHVYSPAAIHHIGNGTMGKRASNYEVLPLCPMHHQHGGYGIAVHAGRKAWEAAYGTERELLERVNNELGYRD